MLDINLIRTNPELVKKGIGAKNANVSLVDNFLELDKKWRDLTKKVDDLRSEQKKLGKEDKEKGSKIKAELKGLDENLSELEKMRDEVLMQMPNLPMPSAPIAKDEKGNKVIKEVGKKPEIKNPKDYFTLALDLDLIDTERAAKVSGSRFGYIKGAAAMLEFALIDLAMKTLVKEGFTPVIPPVLVNEKSMRAMGYMERGADEIYHLPVDNLYLVGTSEQSVGPMHQGEVLAGLPKKYISFSTCFRREAGSYGKDTKGILRVHQFNKMEMFIFCEPQKSEEMHKYLLSLEEKLMQALELPYRVIDTCTGDLGDPAAAKYDIEAWMPGQNGGKGEYRETHSTSNTTDFQARRLGIKYKNAEGKSEFVHMLNGTAFSERPILAIIENYQTEKGTILVPKILQDYLGIKEITK
ncbi:MAG: serine--tRNA ligase [Candidatus Pacebacteria bacterium]|nr:serine--tRNA ligase [Candidatus Paceibacterota bacterium]